MLLKSLVLGNGNAGGQVALEALNLKMKAIAINGSTRDLATLGDEIPKIIFGDGMGSGKDRDVSKDFLAKRIEAFMKHELLNKEFNDANVVFVVCGAAGGYGSGVTPMMCSIMSNRFDTPESPLIIIPVGIFPEMSEAILQQQNALEFMNECESLGLAYMIYDNGKIKDEINSKAAINKMIVQDFQVLTGLYNRQTPGNSIDERELINILRTPGRIAVATAYDIKERDLSKKSLERLLLDNLKVGAHAELVTERIISKVGIITNLKSNIKFDRSLPEFSEIYLESVAVYDHDFICKDEENVACIVMAGLSKPDGRIQKMTDRVLEVKEELQKQKQASNLGSVVSEMSFLDGFLKQPKQEEKKKDVSDILSQFMK